MGLTQGGDMYEDKYGVIAREKGRKYPDHATASSEDHKHRGQGFHDSMFVQFRAKFRQNMRMPASSPGRFPAREVIGRDWWDDEEMFGPEAWTTLDKVSPEDRAEWAETETAWDGIISRAMMSRDDDG